MKVQLRRAETAWKRLCAVWKKMAKNPAAGRAARCVHAMAAGFVLAGVAAGGVRLPLSVALTAALGQGLPALCAYVGGCVGYLAFWGWGAVMEPMAAGLLVAASSCIFADVQGRQSRWLAPMWAALYTALVGFLFLLEQQFSPSAVWQWGLRWMVAFGAAWCFRQAREKQANRLFLLCCLCGGLCAVKLPGSLPAGVIAAAMLSVSAIGTELSAAAAVSLGLTLDLVWMPGCASAVFLLGNLAAATRKQTVVRLAVWLGCVLLGVLLTNGSYLLVAGGILGLAGALLPGNRLFGTKAAVRRSDPQQHLLADLLQQLSCCLSRSRSGKPEPETATVFDRAAERVCRLCARWDDCWESGEQETYRAMEQAAVPMMTRGKALREDFPAVFAGQCRHMEGLLHALNRELDDLRCRRQYRSRLRESRAVLAQQYEAMAHALSCVPSAETVCRFVPEIGFRSQGRRDDTVSGDRGASFRCGKWYYVLLCDGMGTGPWARAEAEAAIEILRRLLQAGMEAEEALQMINGVYILRDDGGFATIDLLQADLQTGAAVLHKWGAPPSYLKQLNHVTCLHASQLPPGVDVSAEREGGIALELGQGEMLVLVSDGVEPETADRCIRQYTGQSVKELAAAVLAVNGTEAQDDTTAVVIRLRADGGT